MTLESDSEAKFVLNGAKLLTAVPGVSGLQPGLTAVVVAAALFN